jgi:hypothetical protein
MAIQNEVWASVIQDVLFQTDLTFINNATRQDDYINFRTVNLPQAGGGIGVTKNYSGALPATVEQRTDTVSQYSVDEYSTDVVVIRYAEALQVSYDKQASVVRQQANALAQVIGSNVLNTWALPTATGAVFTSGATVSTWLEGSQTGTRKLPTINDLLKLKTAMDLDYVPQDNRYLTIPSSMFAALLTQDDIKNAISFYGFAQGSNTLPGATLPMIAGFQVIQRPTVAAYATGTTASILSLGAAGTYTLGATDNLAALAFHSDFVATAFGGVQAFTGIGNDPQYIGGQSLMALAMLGATRLRTDNVGVKMLIMGS